MFLSPPPLLSLPLSLSLYLYQGTPPLFPSAPYTAKFEIDEQFSTLSTILKPQSLDTFVLWLKQPEIV